MLEIGLYNLHGGVRMQGENQSQGTVTWFNDRKGFGFIEPASGGQGIYVHHTEIDAPGFRTLKEGTKVSFHAEKGNRGLEAREVKILS